MSPCTMDPIHQKWEELWHASHMMPLREHCGFLLFSPCLCVGKHFPCTRRQRDTSSQPFHCAKRYARNGQAIIADDNVYLCLTVCRCVGRLTLTAWIRVRINKHPTITIYVGSDIKLGTYHIWQNWVNRISQQLLWYFPFFAYKFHNSTKSDKADNRQ
jgi:hypothetical protein